jgi:annexin A7/11
MDEALQFVAKGAEGDGYGVHREVELLEESMKGAGTKDERLSKSSVQYIFSISITFPSVTVYRVIRAHWNRPRFQAIKQTFHQKYGKTLLARVRGETSGDYKDFMSAVIGN